MTITGVQPLYLELALLSIEFAEFQISGERSGKGKVTGTLLSAGHFKLAKLVGLVI